jgi:hypothetical protein
MENDQIAELIANEVYKSNHNDTDFAIQLFIEKFALPVGVGGYTKDDLKRYILLSLEKKDNAIVWETHINQIRTGNEQK